MATLRLSFDDTVHNVLPNKWALKEEMLRSSFFLPPDVILAAKNAGWTIHPIKIATQNEWRQTQQILETAETPINRTPDSRLIINCAKQVGVSVRINAITGRKYVCVKLWTGGAAVSEYYAGGVGRFQ